MENVSPKYRQTLQQPGNPRKQNTNTRATKRVEHPQLYKYIFHDGCIKENGGGGKVLQEVTQRETGKAEGRTRSEVHIQYVCMLFLLQQQQFGGDNKGMLGLEI